MRFTNLNPGNDVRATQLALEQLGYPGQLHDPSGPIDCMNSGTTARLLMGVCAGANLRATFVGDASLSKRPMEPVAAQLRAFGAKIETTNGFLPAHLEGTSQPQTRRFILISPSAQVKSALLLCGVFGKTKVSVLGDRNSRDHTERMLQTFGANITSDGREVAYEPGPLAASDIYVPGDFSAAAFFIVAATITAGSDITIKDVGVNPTRTGLLDALLAMGARIELSNPRTIGGEPVADVHVVAAKLQGTTVGADLALRAIDEILVLSVAAAQAAGPTKITGIGDLRNKESDRVAAIARILDAVDVSVDVVPNGIEIAGGPGRSGNDTILTHGDHRTAMSVAALAAAAGPLTIDDSSGIDVSFPGFANILAKAQARTANRPIQSTNSNANRVT